MAADPAVPPEAYEAATLKVAGAVRRSRHGQLCPVWVKNAAIGECDCWILRNARMDARDAVDGAWPILRSLGVAEGRRLAAEAMAKLQARFDRHMWGHDWRPSGVDGIARCRHCSFGKEGEPSSHQMSCRLYEGPLRHEWLGHLARTNPTFGGDDYYCICGGWFRRGGMAGHGDGTSTAEPACPNADQTWRGAARIAEGNTDG